MTDRAPAPVEAPVHDETSVANWTADDAEEHATDGSRRQTNWGVFAYIALALVTLALIWALVLTTVLVNNSVQATAHAVDLVTAAGQEHQRTLTELNTQLNETRQGTESELAKTRQLVTDTTSTLATLADNNSQQWQDIARTANQNVADTSNQTLGLVGSTLQQVQGQEAALGRAAAAREAAAAARADAADSAIRSDLASARSRADAAQAATIAAEQRAAADVKSVQAAARAVVQTAIDALTARLARAEALLDELIHHLPHPPGTDADLASARQGIDAARTDLDAVSAATTAESSAAADLGRITAQLHTVTTSVSSAEQALDRVRALG